ncbi:MAG: erythromycin esterase family protein [Anaerolineales bacterium]
MSGSIGISESPYNYLEDRNRAMETNVRWAIEQLNSQSRVILWGHDFDLLRTTDLVPGEFAYALAAQPSLGDLLGTMLGEQPFHIGLVLSRGTMTGADSLEPYPIGSPPAGSFEWMGAGTGLSIFLLPDLSGGGSTMLDRRILGRALHSNDSEIGFQLLNFAQAYDALIYVDQVWPTRSLANLASPERDAPAAACSDRAPCIE